MPSRTSASVARPEQVDPANVYVRIVRDIQGASLTQAEIARLVHANTRSIQNWAAGTNKPGAAARDRLLELDYLCKRLREFLSPEATEIFWHSRSQWLDGQRPIDVLEAGEFDTVLRMVAAMGNGDY